MVSDRHGSVLRSLHVGRTYLCKGETLLIPDGTGMLEFKGEMDLFPASYRNEK
ncbi:hypothetical protein AR1Y2_1660 [Anaerostipes rhamnosivorans]|uniref:Uncharacterized protein n=1 Tax=Anaerostipes rhamnosivorans TaxID=1229621 RepID=A0A4P8IGY0_9FIRM|nr:hypothetical protein AR1Y2_1660 [Anaerostipes rhamnosivorans]